MLGASDSIACANIMLNAAVAESLRQYADRLEKASDFKAELRDVLKQAIINHKRIIFNGNGYSKEWIEEAKRRGLSNLPATPDCLPKMLDKKNVEMLKSHGIYTEMEVRSRYEILLENYVGIVTIEAATMLDMAQRDILPAVSAYSSELCERALGKAKAGIENGYEKQTSSELSKLETEIMNGITELRKAADHAAQAQDVTEHSMRIRDKVIPAMKALRCASDKAETLMDNRRWPLPTYAQLMFGV